METSVYICSKDMLDETVIYQETDDFLTNSLLFFIRF